ncbi:DUF3800 domain-containing protein [Leptospira meyeri]|uniref:DUF3800 domain-containing protein n=1 Tax=Leptospira meyeri TaxID=29508 RepID=UPI0002C00A3F|nr:DUF3800 domain-containing protein [Leptospira meyeri]EMJ87275.1 PF12686 family protein [Leptospira meyeri serovar Semaranga str. Veldrot Semarang 173]
MILIYTDESGINFQFKENIFKDGPWLIHGGILINEKKYFHLERLFLEIIDEYFGITDWSKLEIHATEMWNKRGYFEKFPQNKIFNFFEELIQILIKLEIEIPIGIQYKPFTIDEKEKNLIMIQSINSFFHLIERHLSKQSETGIIISDQKGTNTQKNIFESIFNERVSWRSNPNKKIEPSIKLKYKYEARSCFILDNIHYVDSKSSIFNQIADIVLYIIMRVLTYQDLRLTNYLKPDLSKVPISSDTFTYFFQKSLSIATYQNSSKDIMFVRTESFENLLSIQSTSILSDECYLELKQILTN